MSFDGIAEKSPGIQLDGSKPETGVGGVVSDSYAAIRIPLKIDDWIMVHSPANLARMFRCRIIGAKHGEFILITAPAVQINDRISAVLDGEFFCSYFGAGKLYNFRSGNRRDLINDTVCIDYPREMEVSQVRKYRRIRVNIETRCALIQSGYCFSADMADISFGGCRLVVHEGCSIKKGAFVSLTFSLPDGTVISELQAVAVKVVRSPDKESTEIGLSFKSPEGEFSKVSNFCEFCMFFELE